MKNEEAPPTQVDQPPKPPWFAFGPKNVACVRQVEAQHINVTSIDQTAAVAFDDLLANLQQPEEPLAAVVVASFELPAEVLSNDRFVGYVADFRGFCSTTAGARAVLTAQIGSAVHVQNFAYDEPHDGDWSAQVFSFERRLNKDSGQPVIPLPPLTIHITLSVQRRTKDDVVAATVDTIDIVAIRS